MPRSFEREFMLPASVRHGAWAMASGYRHSLSLPLCSCFTVWIGCFVIGVFVGKGTAF